MAFETSAVEEDDVEADDSLSLRSFGIPPVLVDCYRRCGVELLFDWQADCLRLDGVLSAARNLIYSAPTSAGKTLVAEILTAKRRLETKTKAIFVLPFVALARQKMVNLQRIYSRAGIRVEGYIGTLNPAGGLQSWDVAVCTIEKANALLNRLIQDREINLIGTIVIDELHMIGDSGRGYILELMLTKILHLNKTVFSGVQIQIIGMSATVGEMEPIGAWLDAAVYATDFRPVPLTEMIATGSTLKVADDTVIRTLPAHLRFVDDPESVVGWVLETVVDGGGVLIFCSSKVGCEKLAEQVARRFHAIVTATAENLLSKRFTEVMDHKRLKRFVDRYRTLTNGKESFMYRLLSYGVCYHHAGLPTEERDNLEAGFHDGVLKVIVATSTLSSGVNLPAKRVIIRSPWGGGGRHNGPQLTSALYRQMAGRAGRMGIDSSGESILMCKDKAEFERAQQLITGPLPSITSALNADNDDHKLERTLIEAIASGIATTMEQLVAFLRCSFWAALEQESGEDLIRTFIIRCVDRFRSAKILASESCSDNGASAEVVERLEATQLGSAMLASSLAPGEALAVYDDLKTAANSLCLNGELHMIYLVTPMQQNWGYDFNWAHFYELWCRLPIEQRQVGLLVGVNDAFLLARSRTAFSRKDTACIRKEAIHMRFYSALSLLDLINECPLIDTAEKFRCSRGFLQSLQQQASTYAGMVVTFCDRLGWHYLKALLSGFAERLAFGVRRDLTELVQLQGMDGSRARIFHTSQIQTIASIVHASVEDIEALLKRAVPFDENETAAQQPWLCNEPSLSLQEAAVSLKRRAADYLTANLQRLGVALELAESAVLPPNIADERERAADVSNTTTPAKQQLVGKTSTASKARQSVLLDQNISNLEQSVDELIKDVSCVSISPSCSFRANTSRHPPLALNCTNSSDIELKLSEDEVTHSPMAAELTDDKTTENHGLSDSALVRIFDDDDTETSDVQGTDSEVETSGAENKNPHVDHGLSESTLLRMFSADTSLVDGVAAGEVDDSKDDSEPNESCEDMFGKIESPAISPTSTTTTESREVLAALPQNQPVTSAATKRKRTPNIRFPAENNTPSPLIRKRTCSRVVNAENPIFASDGASTSSESVRIIDTCACKNRFGRFRRTALEHSGAIAISFAVKKCNSVGPYRELLSGWQQGTSVVGYAVALAASCVYYTSLSSDHDESHLGSSAVGETPDDRITVDEKLQCLEEIVKHGKYAKLVALDVKRFALLGRKLFGTELLDEIQSKLICLQTANWMVNSDTALETHFDLLKKQLPVKLPTGDSARERCSAEAMASLLLWPLLKKRLVDTDQLDAYSSIQLPSIDVLVQMEWNGFGFDAAKCGSEIARLKAILERLEDKAAHLAGHRFSLSSPTEVAKVLFEELRLPPSGIGRTAPCTATNRRHYSTGKDILQRLVTVHPLPEVILDWRKVQNALVTGYYPLMKHSNSVRPSNSDVRFVRVRGEFDAFTATGRVVMHEPNLQILPRAVDINVCDTAAEPRTTCVNVRDCFVAGKGCTLVAVDYCQLELRVLAHMSNDERLLAILNRDGGDVFREIVSEWTNITPSGVTQQQRQQAKQICYGIIYGMGSQTLAETLDVSVDRATELISNFKNAYPKVQTWILQTIEWCRRDACVRTLSNRLRPLAHITSSVSCDRAQAQRQAVNTVIQGTAADLFKSALNRIVAAVRDGRLECMVVMQLHDEVLVETKTTGLMSTVEQLRQLMEGCWPTFRVRLPVKVKTGQSWGSLSDM